MKKIFGFAAVIAMVAAVNVRMSSNNNEVNSALQLETLEASAFDWDEYFSDGWWDRKDWACVPITCRSLTGQTWQSTALGWSMGGGTNAHMIICPEC